MSLCGVGVLNVNPNTILYNTMTHQVPLVLSFVVGMAGDSYAKTLPADVARNMRHAYHNFDGAKRACSCGDILCSFLSAEAFAFRELLRYNPGYPCRYMGCYSEYTTAEGADRHMKVMHGYQTGHLMLYNKASAPAPPSPVIGFAATRPNLVFATGSFRTRSKRRRS